MSALREIDAEVALEFTDDPTAGTFVCHAAEGSLDLTRLQEGAYQALWLLKRLQFDAPLPWTSESLWTWFAGNVQRIQFRRLETGIGARWTGFGNMQISSLSPSSPGFPTLAFLLVHEARHADHKWHTCNNKDPTIAEMGSSGTAYYFGLWVADHTLAPELTIEDREYARYKSKSSRAFDFCAECGGL